MNVETIRIIFNDEGADTFVVDDEEIEFGDIRESVEDVRESLERLGYRTILTPLTQDRFDEFLRELTDGRADLVFNMCEGAFLNSKFEMNIAALLELYGLKFTGNPSITLGVALNKGWTKDILRGAGIDTPEHFIASAPSVDIPQGLDFPLIVKPLTEDASLGIETDSVVYTREELSSRIEHILEEYSSQALVERFVDGREFNVALMGNDDATVVLPPSEIDFSEYPEELPRICSYEAKWIEVSPLYRKTPPVCPAPVSEELKQRLESTALMAYRALSCRDYARVDMRLDKDGNLWVLEVNPNPDISKDAGFARAARAAGLEYHQFIGELVSIAAKRYE